jgi:hypothetical protein
MTLKETNTKLQNEVDKIKKELNSVNQKYNTIQQNLNPIVENNEQLTKRLLKNPFKKDNLENEQNKISKSASYYNHRPHQRKIFNENSKRYTVDFPEIKDESEEFKKANVQNEEYKIAKTVKNDEFFLQQYKEKFNKLQIKSKQNSKEFNNSQIENLTPIMEKLVASENDIEVKQRFTEKTIKTETLLSKFENEKITLKNQTKKVLSIKQNNFTTDVSSSANHEMKKSKSLLIFQEHQINTHEIELKQTKIELEKIRKLNKEMKEQNINLADEKYKLLEIMAEIITAKNVSSSANQDLKNSKSFLFQENQISIHGGELKQAKIELEKVRKLNKDLFQENQISTYEYELKETKIELKMSLKFNKEIQKKNINLAKEKYKLLEIITKNFSKN